MDLQWFFIDLAAESSKKNIRPSLEDLEQPQPTVSIIHPSTWSKAGSASTLDCHFCVHCWSVGTSPPLGLAVDTIPGQAANVEPCWDPGSSPSAHTHHSVCHCAVRAPLCAALSRADLPENPLPQLPSSFLWGSIQRYSLPQS